MTTTAVDAFLQKRQRSVPDLGDCGSEPDKQGPAVDATYADPIGELYVRLKPLLQGIAVRKFGVPREEAEALTHDVFTALLCRRDAIRDARTWCIGAICNASRYYQRWSHHFVVSDPALLDTRLVEPADVTRLTVATLLGRLRTRDQTILRLRFTEGHTVPDLARIMGVTPKRATKLLRGALDRAARVMAPT